MRKRIFTARSVAIIGGLALVAVVILGGLALWIVQSEPQLTLTGGGTTIVGATSVKYVLSDRGIALVIWYDNASGPSGSGTDSSFFTSTARGFFSAADGRRIDWEWKAPKEKGGDFHINGTPYDLANGTLILVSTKGGQVRVTQLDVDLSKVQPNQQGIEALSKNEPKVVQFIAETSGQK